MILIEDYIIIYIQNTKPFTQCCFFLFFFHIYIYVLGCGCVLPTLLSYVYISRAFPPKTAPKYLTTMTLGAGIGFMVTPYITEVLLSHLGWRGTLMMASGMFLQLVLIGSVIQVNLPPPSELQKSRDFKWTDVVEILKNRSYLTYITTMLFFGLFGNTLCFQVIMIAIFKKKKRILEHYIVQLFKQELLKYGFCQIF